jgi:hypothetical protein
MIKMMRYWHSKKCIVYLVKGHKFNSILVEGIIDGTKANHKVSFLQELGNPAGWIRFV